MVVNNTQGPLKGERCVYARAYDSRSLNAPDDEQCSTYDAVTNYLGSGGVDVTAQTGWSAVI